MKNIAASVFVSVGSLREKDPQTALWRDLVWGGTEASYEEPAPTSVPMNESWKTLGSEWLELSWERNLPASVMSSDNCSPADSWIVTSRETSGPNCQLSCSRISDSQ